MCFRRQLDPKSRRIFAAGNLCLLAGLLLTQFENSIGHRHPAVLLALRFALMGAAITLLFWSARRSRNCAPRF